VSTKSVSTSSTSSTIGSLPAHRWRSPAAPSSSSTRTPHLAAGGTESVPDVVPHTLGRPRIVRCLRRGPNPIGLPSSPGRQYCGPILTPFPWARR
jgi:hypothetical protein